MTAGTRPLVNTWNQLTAAVAAGIIAQERAVAVGYVSPATRGAVSGWRVWSPFFKTDPAASYPWSGKKWFSPQPGNQWRDPAEPIAWAIEQYGITDWRRNRVGEYVPAEVEEQCPIPPRGRPVTEQPELTYEKLKGPDGSRYAAGAGSEYRVLLNGVVLGTVERIRTATPAPRGSRLRSGRSSLSWVARTPSKGGVYDSLSGFRQRGYAGRWLADMAGRDRAAS